MVVDSGSWPFVALPDDVLTTILLSTEGFWKAKGSSSGICAASVCMDFRRILNDPRNRCQLMVRRLLRKVLIQLNRGGPSSGPDGSVEDELQLMKKAGQELESHSEASPTFASSLVRAMAAVATMSYSTASRSVIAAFSSRPTLVRRLLTDAELDTLLIDAVHHLDVEVVRILVTAGASLLIGSYCHNPPTIVAMYTAMKMREFLKILMSAHGFHVHASQALLFAIRMNDLAAVTLFVEHGVPLDDEVHVHPSSRPLFVAVSKNRAEIVRILIRAGAKPDFAVHGRSQLMRAAIFGYVDIVAILVEGGADLEFRDYEGNTTLMLAAECGRSDVVRYLVQSGASLNAVNLHKKSAVALARDHLVRRFLIDAGAADPKPTRLRRIAEFVSCGLLGTTR